MSVADLKSKIAEAIAANEAGKLDLAERKVRSALMLLAGMPNARTTLGGQDWDHNALVALLSQIRQAKTEQSAAIYGIQRTKIRYARVGAQEEC